MSDAQPTGDRLTEGELLEVEIGAPAHGGHCVARHEGRVLFVRHVLRGERALVRVTDVRKRFARAELEELLQASPERVEPPCAYAGPGRCGGCDWQHTSPQEQRRIKAGVVIEQLTRLGRLDAQQAPLAGLQVEEVPGARPDGTGWRTRVQFAVTPDGRLGLRGHRSHEVVPVERCLLATDAVEELELTGRDWAGWARVEAVASSGGDRAVLLGAEPGRPVPALASLPGDVAVAGPQGRRGRGFVTELVPTPDGTLTARVSGSGFWQVHPGAPQTLLQAVLDQLDPRPGQHILDLYCGVGLFALGLAPRVGAGGRVTAVESDAQAVKDARRNLYALPQVKLVEQRVDRALRALAQCDTVVLDPPRAGAGKGVLEQIARLGADVVSYVACDPAALGRDTALLAEQGYRLTGLRAFDLFPHTQHVECVARFAR